MAITIVYAVAGHKNHYINLAKALASLERIKIDYEVLILSENKNHVDTYGYRWVQYRKQPSQKHEFWRMRYDLLDYIETEYVMYADSDTVFVNDTLERHMQAIGERFAICQHFWVPTIKDYIAKAMGSYNAQQLLSLGFNDFENHFIASGAFLFKNNHTNRKIIQETCKNYDLLYPQGSKYIEHMTDEVWLSGSINRVVGSNFYHLIGGFNHCCEPPMPLRLENGIIQGKNPQDSAWEDVTLLHCDTFRRDPSAPYGGDLKSKIQELFYL